MLSNKETIFLEVVFRKFSGREDLGISRVRGNRILPEGGEVPPGITDTAGGAVQSSHFVAVIVDKRVGRDSRDVKEFSREGTDGKFCRRHENTIKANVWSSSVIRILFSDVRRVADRDLVGYNPYPNVISIIFVDDADMIKIFNILLQTTTEQGIPSHRVIVIQALRKTYIDLNSGIGSFNIINFRSKTKFAFDDIGNVPGAYHGEPGLNVGHLFCDVDG
jgi:hypothetical protein